MPEKSETNMALKPPRKRHHRLQKIIERGLLALMILLFALGLWQLALAGWIQGKAVIAQWLLQQAWREQLADGQPHKPWPVTEGWADTWPVAELRVPALGIRQIVLHGDDGASLAYGPGLSLAGAPPGQHGTTLISGHRDTHFAFLQRLRPGDLIELVDRRGQWRYRVSETRIVDSRHFRLRNAPENNTRPRLVLATCYPFDAVQAGGPLRYLVDLTISN